MNTRIKIFAVATLALSAHMAFSATETIPELALTDDMTVTVESGDVKHIEYLSGTANAKLTKEGDGTLEIAIVGSTHASFFVNGGGLKFVRPGKLALAADDVAFHIDGSDADARDVTTENGTNFVTKIKDVEGRSTYATKSPLPLSKDA